MNETSVRFVGSVPENYDQGLGPHIFEDYAADLARRAALVEAEHVLELAAGTGIASRKLRDALPPEARLMVTDLNPPMLEVARGKFTADEVADFRPADAMAMPFENAAFDLIVCQFGVMFFPDKRKAFREANRVLHPDGTYLFNAWDQMSANPFSEVAYDVGARFFPDDPPGFYRVPFSYPDPAVVTTDLAAAGFRDIGHERVPLAKEVNDWTLFARGIVFGNPLIGEINDRPGVEADEVMAAIVHALRERFGQEPASMPLQATVYSARAS
jgi:SAM-dependent methyltransferase